MVIHTRQSGAALMLVMWFVAALSIVALSLSAGARIDLRGATQFVAMTQVEALARSGMQLILLELESDPPAFANGFRREYAYDGQQLTVEIRPESAFVNLNAASVELLRDLFIHAGEMVPDKAEDLARAVVDWRTPSATDGAARAYESVGVAFRPRGAPFEAPADLLQVLGMSYEAYVKIAGLLTVYGAAAGVDPRYAPEALLKVLANGEDKLARQIAEAQGRGELELGTAGLQQAYLVRGSGAVAYRVDVLVSLDGVRYVRRAWVEQNTGGRAVEPWRTLTSDAVTTVREMGETDRQER